MQVKFEQWVPVTAGSVAAHCGEGKVTVEVQQNFLGNGWWLLVLNWSTVGGVAGEDCPFGSHLTCFLLWCPKTKRVRLETQIGKLNGTVKMGHSVLITANGRDYGLGDQYYVSSYFFTLKKENCAWPGSVLKCWLHSDALRNLFICPVAEPPLAVSVID